MLLSPTAPMVVSPPFRLSALPQEAFAHSSWQRAEAVALACLDAGDCVLLLGLPGTGKTLMLHRLALGLRARGRMVRMLVDGEVPAGALVSDVLLVDEADGLGSARLEMLCLLANPVVLAGLPAFRERFDQAPDAIGAVTLEALSAEEVARFVAGRLVATGRPVSMFGPEAVYALVQHSEGLFRVLAILASASLFFAELRQARQVMPSDVDEAAAMRLAVLASDGDDAAMLDAVSLPRRVGDAGRRWVLAASVGALMVGGVGLLAARRGAPAAETVPQAEAEASGSEVFVPGVEPAVSVAAAVMAPPRAGARRRVVVAYIGSVSSSRPGQDGKLRLRLRSDGGDGPVEAWVYGWDGFSASGRLQGALAADGKVTLTGRLLLGRHEYECALEAALEGDRLIGTARIVRPSTGEISKSNFSLSRS